MAAAGRRPSTSPRCGAALDAAEATEAPAAPASDRRADRAVDHGHASRDRSPAATAADDAPPPTRLAELLDAGHFVVSVEIDPPRSIRIERTIEAARLLRDAGVDVVNVSDSAMARVRMSALSVAFGIQHDLDLECLVHCTTRDRNLMALESELLGAHALGRPQHHRADRRPAADRRLPDRDRDLGHRFDRPDRDADAAQPRRGPDRPLDRPAGRVHHRLRPRFDRRRRDDRVGSPRTEARGRGAPGDDPAALLDRAGRGDARGGAPAVRAGRHARSRSCSASCRWSRPATPSSSTTRSPGSRSPTRLARRCARPASAARRSASRWPTAS